MILSRHSMEAEQKAKAAKEDKPSKAAEKPKKTQRKAVKKAE